MSAWTQTDRRIGTLSASGAVAIVAVYVVTGLIGVIARPLNSNPLYQIDPYLSVLEILLSLAAVDLVIVMAVVYAYAPREQKTFALIALSFVLVFAVLTCSVHFASLTVGRQVDPLLFPLRSHQLSFEWLTLALSLDLLAWDFFLGLALVFASLVFRGRRLAGQVRVSLIVAGSLCLAGTLGPASGHAQFQYLGIAGYIFALPVACLLLARLFRRGSTSESEIEVG